MEKAAEIFISSPIIFFLPIQIMVCITDHLIRLYRKYMHLLTDVVSKAILGFIYLFYGGTYPFTLVVLNVCGAHMLSERDIVQNEEVMVRKKNKKLWNHGIVKTTEPKVTVQYKIPNGKYKTETYDIEEDDVDNTFSSKLLMMWYKILSIFLSKFDTDMNDAFDFHELDFSVDSFTCIRITNHMYEICSTETAKEIWHTSTVVCMDAIISLSNETMRVLKPLYKLKNMILQNFEDGGYIYPFYKQFKDMIWSAVKKNVMANKDQIDQYSDTKHTPEYLVHQTVDFIVYNIITLLIYYNFSGFVAAVVAYTNAETGIETIISIIPEIIDSVDHDAFHAYKHEYEKFIDLFTQIFAGYMAYYALWGTNFIRHYLPFMDIITFPFGIMETIIGVYVTGNKHRYR